MYQIMDILNYEYTKLRIYQIMNTLNPTLTDYTYVLHERSFDYVYSQLYSHLTMYIVNCIVI